MSLFLCADVQRGPLGVPIERKTVLAPVGIIYLLEGFKLDESGPLFIEKAKGNLILGIGFRKEVIEEGPVVQRDATSSTAVCDLKEKSILLALDFMLFGTRC